MTQQGLLRGTAWTIRNRMDESLAHWLGRVPAGQQEIAGDCDHETPWMSGGVLTVVCTHCGDTSAAECEQAHADAVAVFKAQFPEAP